LIQVESLLETISINKAHTSMQCMKKFNEDNQLQVPKANLSLFNLRIA